MFQKIKENIAYPKKVLGLNIHYSSRDSYQLQACLLIKKKNKVEFIEKRGYVSLEEVGERYSNIPISICITGVQVISKIYENGTIDDIFSSTDLDQFYTQMSRGQASIVRKEVVDEIVSVFKEAGSNIIGINIGEAVLSILSQLADEYELVGGNKRLKFSEIHEIMDQESSDATEIYTLGEDELSSEMIIAYCGAIQYLVAGIPLVEITGQEENYFDIQVNSRVYKASLVFSIGLILVLLLGNFFWFMSLRDKQQEYSATLSAYQVQQNKLNSQKLEFDQKNKFLLQSGWTSGYPSAYLLDQIGLSVPGVVGLTKLEINPKDLKRSKKEKKTVLDMNVVNIEGTCNDSYRLNEWIKELNKFEWVQDAQLLNFDNSPTKRKAEFKVKVELANAK